LPLLAQDDGNEPCCYNAPHNPALNIGGQSLPLLAQDDGNEPCCYNGPRDSSININDQTLALLSGREPGRTNLVGLPLVAPAIHPTAVLATEFLGEERHGVLVMETCKLAIRQS